MRILPLKKLTMASAVAVASLAATAALAADFHFDGNNFKLDATPAPCTAGSECVVTVRLEATVSKAGDAYHINKSYPYKFKANETAGVEFLGKEGDKKNVFSRASGDFAEQGEKVATMSLKFKPSAKGNVTISGTYKMSVCSEKNCQLESQDVSVAVNVK